MHDPPAQGRPTGILEAASEIWVPLGRPPIYSKYKNQRQQIGAEAHSYCLARGTLRSTSCYYQQKIRAAE